MAERFEVKVRLVGDHPHTGWHVISTRSPESARTVADHLAEHGGWIGNRRYRPQDIEKIWLDEDRSRAW